MQHPPRFILIHLSIKKSAIPSLKPHPRTTTHTASAAPDSPRTNGSTAATCGTQARHPSRTPAASCAQPSSRPRARRTRAGGAGPRTRTAAARWRPARRRGGALRRWYRRRRGTPAWPPRGRDGVLSERRTASRPSVSDGWGGGGREGFTRRQCQSSGRPLKTPTVTL